MPDENRNSNNNSESILNLDPDILTPGMKQYLEVKKAHPDCLVMLRMGDFYEMFYQDAITAAKELEITLTARGKGETRAPLAGVPFHALETYLGRLVKRGYKVAIVEQLEDPKKAKGLVKRGLVRIVTPGTVIESSMLQENENNYVACVTVFGEEFSLALADVSTGEFWVVLGTGMATILHELLRFTPSECVIPRSLAVNAELVTKIKNIRDGSSRGTLLSVLDKTITPMGARLLRAWLKTPLLQVNMIEKRLEAIELLNNDVILREECRDLLKRVYDVERLIGRINYGNATPRDVIALK